MSKGKKIALIGSAAVLLIGGGAYALLNRKSQPQYVTARVERGNLSQTVTETGNIKAADELNLDFLSPGTIAKLSVKIGDKVEKDQPLAELDDSDLLIQEREAEANLTVAIANLDKIRSGSTLEAIAVSQANAAQARAAYSGALDELAKASSTVSESVSQAQKNLDDLTSSSPDGVTTYEQAVTVAKTNLDNARSTYQRSIDNSRINLLLAIEAKAVANDTALDNINTILNDSDAKPTLSIADPDYLVQTQTSFDEAKASDAAADASLAAAQTGGDDASLDKAVGDSLASLNKTFSSLHLCYDVLGKSIASSDFSQASLDAYKTAVNAQITAISTAISAVEAAKQAWDGAALAYDTNVASAQKNLDQAQTGLDNAVTSTKNALETAKTNGSEQLAAAQAKVDTSLEALNLAQAQLSQIQSPARSEDISLYQAQVTQSQAALDLVKNKLDQSVLKAPIDGVITKVNYEVGEQPTAAEPVISMLSANNLEVEILVSESDISKVKLGDPVEFTLDAFGPDKKFSGSVFFIEPAETVVQDVIYYKVEINLPQSGTDPADDGIKAGMTANASITTDHKDNILMMPLRAVVEKSDGSKIVRIKKGDKIEEVPVSLGLRGDEGMVEVLSGVSEGDEVVTFVKTQ